MSILLPADQNMLAMPRIRPASGSRGRPLEIVLVNLMPFKQATEQQFAELLDSPVHDVRLRLVVPPGHASRHTAPEHIARHYTPWQRIARRPVDGLIVTGAPVEHLPFDQVDYWPWFREMVDWAAARAGHSLFICWAGQAMLHHRFGIAKQALPEKAFGIHRQTVIDRGHPLMAGLPAEIAGPVSRHSAVDAATVMQEPALRVVAASAQSGLAIVDDPRARMTAMFNHIEYDARTLHEEYLRDRAAGRPIALPHDYYRNGVLMPPVHAPWRATARQMFDNWLDGLAGAREMACAA